ncbi:hypothetical protein DAEQUDRAFT_481570 [Daedalea quercina L-15889]|uniref:Ankyrin n=1 Tax=Daedalea quercina L-15889 TaxID=1314783 RepID=A0A165MTZ9_9APHY|nr:hypothetical protein DAEQUDRAFT_481570 [Daedalea quercina L-15889]
MDALARTLLLRCYKNWNMAKDKVDMVIRSLLASETASLRFIAYAVRHVLRDCRSIGDVQRTVQRLRLGSGLEDAYRAILDKVLQGDESVAKLVKRVFVWLLGTQRPLTAEELWEAILIDRKSDGSVDVTVEQRWFDQHRLFQDHCYGMVEHSNKSGKVVLADMSVQEFLPNYTGPGNDKPFADRRVRLVTAKAVVSYAILDLKDPRGDHPLRGYASATLADHLLSVGIPDRRLLDLTLQFVGTLLERQHGLSSPWKFGWKMLSTITSGPFLSVARALNPKWLNADIPAYGCTPLMLAVDHQDFKAVEALVRTLRVNIKQKSRIPNYRSTEQDKDVKVEPSVYARRKQSQTIRDLLG